MRKPENEAARSIELIDRFAPADEKGQAEQFREVLTELAAALKEEGAKNLLHATDEQIAAYAVTVTAERAAQAQEAIQALRDAGNRMDAEKAACAALRTIQTKTPDRLESVATNHTYKGCLTRFAEAIAKDGVTLKDVTVTRANEYLNDLKERGLSQKTIDQNRQAIQALFIADGRLAENGKLERVKTDETVLTSRAYTAEQIGFICERQSERYALATRIMYESGVRAEGLLTLRRIEERAPDVRHYADGSVKALPEKFQGLPEGRAYTVQEKGGLIREIRIPEKEAAQLESLRRAEPVWVSDRGIRYQSFYDLPGGSRVSSSFSHASQKALGWSNGAHGCRHSYAQNRMDTLQRAGVLYERALEVVSQEMGHFRDTITLTYLR